MTHEFTVTSVIPAEPEQIYNAWLDSEGHSKMTGSPAHASAEVGGKFDAWDGYISGENLELEPGKRIVQAWKGRDYTEADGYSQIDVRFQAVEGGTKVVLHHQDIPDSQTTHQAGWTKHYFDPMKKYFGGTD